jgi:hypothetical protein
LYIEWYFIAILIRFHCMTGRFCGLCEGYFELMAGLVLSWQAVTENLDRL